MESVANWIGNLTRGWPSFAILLVIIFAMVAATIYVLVFHGPFGTFDIPTLRHKKKVGRK